MATITLNVQNAPQVLTLLIGDEECEVLVRDSDDLNLLRGALKAKSTIVPWSPTSLHSPRQVGKWLNAKE